MRKKDTLFIKENASRLEMIDGTDKSFNELIRVRFTRKFNPDNFRLFDKDNLVLTIGNDNVAKKVDGDVVEFSASTLTAELVDVIDDKQMNLIINKRPLLLVMIYSDITIFIELLDSNEIEFIYMSNNLQTIMS